MKTPHHKKESELQKTVQGFSRKMKGSWQLFFLPGIILYSLSLLHYFTAKPPVDLSIQAYLRNMDLVSFIIAVVLALIIFNMKRRYFSRRFTRRVVQETLAGNSQAEDALLLQKIFNVLQKKMSIVWGLGCLLILDGVLFYWITYIPQNMNLYFIVGVFSQLLNYPRSDLFNDLPWYVIEERKDVAAETGD